MKKEEKEIIDGYTVQSSLWVGCKRMIYAKDETEQMERPYMKCIYTANELFGRYDDAVISDSFEEIVKLYADDIKAEASILEAENRANGIRKSACLKQNELIPVERDQRIVGEIVAIDPKFLSDGYKSIRNQLFYVTGGNGAEANSRGSACFCTDLNTGKSDRIERYEVLGRVPADKLPDFAKKTMENIRQKEKERNYGGR